MATYVYKCERKECGYIGEYQVPMGTSLDIDCPRCAENRKSSKLVKAVTAPNIHTSSKTGNNSSNASVFVQDMPNGAKRVSYRSGRLSSNFFLPKGIDSPDGFAIPCSIPLSVGCAEAKKAHTLIYDAVRKSRK